MCQWLNKNNKLLMAKKEKLVVLIRVGVMQTLTYFIYFFNYNHYIIFFIFNILFFSFNNLDQFKFSLKKFFNR